MNRTKLKLNLPRAPLPRQVGGAHGQAGRPEPSAREEVAAERLNELDEDDYFDSVLGKLDTTSAMGGY